MATTKTIHQCKCHGNDYTVCPVCECQYCPLYWRACPRCAEVRSAARNHERAAKTTQKATLAIHATCPHCGFNVNILRYEPENGDRYDNGHDRGRGGFRTACESCCEPFVIEADAVHDVQAVALRLLGEA
jgi:hypothetical protein